MLSKTIPPPFLTTPPYYNSRRAGEKDIPLCLSPYLVDGLLYTRRAPPAEQLTKLELASVAKHHWFDLINMEHGSKTVFRKKMARWQNASEWARLVRSRLNDGLPPEREPAAAVQS